jgi:hypothetical protein
LGGSVLSRSSAEFRPILNDAGVGGPLMAPSFFISAFIRQSLDHSKERNEKSLSRW